MGHICTVVLILAHHSAITFWVLCQAPSWTLEKGRWEAGFPVLAVTVTHFGSLVRYWNFLPRGGQLLPGEHSGYLLLWCQGLGGIPSSTLTSGQRGLGMPGGHSPQTLPLVGDVPVEWCLGDSSYATCLLLQSASLEIRCATQSL